MFDIYDDGPSFWMILGAACLVVIALSGTISFFVNLADGIKCQQQAALMERPYSYGFFTGCMVKMPSGWLPMQNFHALNR